MTALADLVAAHAVEHRFSGVVRVDIEGTTVVDLAFGLADRAHGVANQVGTSFAVASITKSFTALVVLRLVEQGVATLDLTARSVLGDDLPLIASDVTLEHLLAHRSGIGDYFDEALSESTNDYILRVPTHTLGTVEAHLSVLDGFPTSFPAGERFSYNNAGFVVLALIAERLASSTLPRLVDELVLQPAGMTHTFFARSDETPQGAAIGYLASDGLRTNILHMPLVGAGDGGLTTTADDLHLLWRALYEGRVVEEPTLRLMTTPHSELPSGRACYGLGVWLGAGNDTVTFEGCDAGISARSSTSPSARTTMTVLANDAEGAWSVAELLEHQLGL